MCHIHFLETANVAFFLLNFITFQIEYYTEHAPYYVVLHFNNSKEIDFNKHCNIKQHINTYRAKIRPLSDFIGLK